MIKLTFTGDVMCEGNRLQDYLKFDGEYDFDDIFYSLRTSFGKSDYVVANLETPLAGKEQKYTFKNYSFNTPDAFAKALKNNNISMVTTANNHVLDRGIEGLNRTLEVLDETGLNHTGSYANEEESKPLVVTIGDMRIAFLAYTYGTEACFNGNYLSKKELYRVNLLRNQELSNPVKRYILTSPHFLAKVFRLIYRIISPTKARMDVSQRKENDFVQMKHLKEDINFCKMNADYIIMCLHCGGQFSKGPTAYTRQIIEFCIKLGVDAIVTNHEHVIHPMEIRNGHPIAFCLGNFTSDYGINRKPMGQLAEYSALLHLYLETGKCVKATFSIMKSIKKDGKIITMPTFDLWNQLTGDDKINLELDVKKCIFLIKGELGKNFKVQDEYEI